MAQAISVGTLASDLAIEVVSRSGSVTVRADNTDEISVDGLSSASEIHERRGVVRIKPRRGSRKLAIRCHSGSGPSPRGGGSTPSEPTRMSIPAQKPRPAPVITTQRTVRSSRASSNTSRISASIRNVRAFSCSGRLSLSQTIPSCSPRRSTSMHPYVTGLLRSSSPAMLPRPAEMPSVRAV